MSQLLFWWGKGAKRGWIYKTIEEFKEEICLSRSEQDTAIKIWKSLGTLKTKREGIPPKRHFQIDLEKLLEHLHEFCDFDMSTSTERFARNSKTIGNFEQNKTDSTSDITSDKSFNKGAKFPTRNFATPLEERERLKEKTRFPQ